MSIIIGNKYKILKQIGEGSFGKIFIGENIITNEQIAIKIDELDNKIMLKNEAKIYNLLINIKGVPKMRIYGKHDKYNFLIMDLLGKNLEEFKINNLSIMKTNKLLKILDIGIQMFTRIKDIHELGIIHRDIKPENFVFGNKDENVIFLIDFGMSKLYMKNNQHIEKQENKKLIGTINFTSINVTKGFTPSRRDDLESIMYILLYLYNNYLPWYKNPNDDDIEMENISCYDKWYDSNILEKKIKYKLEDNPLEFSIILNYIKCLNFNDTPDYKYIISTLHNLYNHTKYTNNILKDSSIY